MQINLKMLLDVPGPFIYFLKLKIFTFYGKNLSALCFPNLLIFFDATKRLR